MPKPGKSELSSLWLRRIAAIVFVVLALPVIFGWCLLVGLKRALADAWTEVGFELDALRDYWR